MISFNQIAGWWTEFWFKPVSPAPICIYRIFYALAVFVYGCLWWPDAIVWFGDSGPYPLAVARQSANIHLSLFFLFSSANSLVLVFLALLLVFSLLLAAGVFTRFSAICLWLLFLSFEHRNPHIADHGDYFLTTTGFLLMFAPCGAMYSVDARRKRKASGAGAEQLKEPWAWRLLQIQTAAVYCQAFFVKIQTTPWLQGMAIYYAAAGAPQHLFIYQAVNWLLLASEFCLWTFIWIRDVRYAVLFLGLIVHPAIASLYDPLVLALVFPPALVNFVYPEHLEAFIGRMKTYWQKLLGEGTKRRQA